MAYDRRFMSEIRFRAEHLCEFLGSGMPFISHDVFDNAIPREAALEHLDYGRVFLPTNGDPAINRVEGYERFFLCLDLGGCCSAKGCASDRCTNVLIPLAGKGSCFRADQQRGVHGTLNSRPWLHTLTFQTPVKDA